MNIQAMLKQAQKMQKDMLTAKEGIDQKTYESKSGMVTVKSNGKKEVIEVKIDADNIEKDELELLQDMIVVAINENNKKIDQETESTLGKYTQGMPGLF